MWVSGTGFTLSIHEWEKGDGCRVYNQGQIPADTQTAMCPQIFWILEAEGSPTAFQKESTLGLARVMPVNLPSTSCSSLRGQHPAPSTKHQAPSIQHPACSTKHPAPSHLPLKTKFQHSAGTLTVAPGFNPEHSSARLPAPSLIILEGCGCLSLHPLFPAPRPVRSPVIIRAF